MRLEDILRKDENFKEGLNALLNTELEPILLDDDRPLVNEENRPFLGINGIPLINGQGNPVLGPGELYDKDNQVVNIGQWAGHL